MALIAANRLTVTIPAGPDAPPSEDTARQRIVRWLEGEYGYPPPVESLEGHGWSERWEVGGRICPGWRYDAVIPRHLGPARDDVVKARHPAGTARSRSAAPGHPARRSAAGARPADRPAAGRSASARRGSATRGGRSARPAVDDASPELARALARIDDMFPPRLPGLDA